MLRVGVDIGGTFTDFVFLDASTGRAATWKRLTTPDDPAEGVLAGLSEWGARDGACADTIGLIVHGTTLVANALIERRGARTGLIATAGHSDALEIGRELRYDIYDLFIENPAPLVERRLRGEVVERIDAAGEELLPVSTTDVEAAVARFRRAGIESIAVCLLHAYANPEHERAVERAIGELWPEVSISISSRVAPEIREFERTSTTVANAYVRPLMAKYLSQLRERLSALAPQAAFYIMFSNGGLVPSQLAQETPVQLVESGPAAGVQAACRYAAGVSEHLLTFDMGGTTAKLSVVSNGAPSLAYQSEVARRSRFKRGSGLPLLVPTVDLIEIGAGGGSVAMVDRLGLLRVGPESAGAQPGPACYGRGGTAPTVTDANLILGYLDEDSFLGGRMSLDRRAAEVAVGRLAKALDLSLTRVAQGIHDLVNENMASAARRHMAERAVDPRGYALIAFGGSGPTHAYGVARRVGVRSIIFPPAAGVASALGCLVAPPSVDLSQSLLVRLDDVDWPKLAEFVYAMRDRALEMLARAHLDSGAVKTQLYADMRYVGQGFEIPISVDLATIQRQDAATLVDAFTGAYRARYGRSVDGRGIEATTWRLSAKGQAMAVDLAALTTRGRPVGGNRHRPVFFADFGGYLACPILERASLDVGTCLQGPAVIEDQGSSALIGPDVDLCIDDGGNVVATLRV